MTRRASAARAAAAAIVAVAAISIGGCATTGAGGTATKAAQRVDPWENWNRKVFAFNEAVDEAVLKPVAVAYRDNVPELVQTGVSNVLGNIYDIWSAANHLLQGKVFTGLDMGMRVLSNTFFGLGGLLDPATEFGLTRHSEDFGQTLGRWGVRSGPFVVLPLFGPSTVRDTAGFLVDRNASPSALPHTDAGTYSVAAIELVATRAALLQTTGLLGGISLDKYSFIRDAYLMRRRDAIHDGAPPLEAYDDFDDFDDEPASEPPAAPASAPLAVPPAPVPQAPGAPLPPGAPQVPR